MIPELKFFIKFPNFTGSLSVSDPSVSVINAVYSSDSKSLSVTLGYNETIAGKKVSVSYTPVSSPYSHALVSNSYDWPVRVGNGMSLTYYSEEAYKNAKIFDYVALAIIIGCLFVFVLSLFFRKMIGVELIVLVQTQVISIAVLN